MSFPVLFSLGFWYFFFFFGGGDSSSNAVMVEEVFFIARAIRPALGVPGSLSPEMLFCLLVCVEHLLVDEKILKDPVPTCWSSPRTLVNIKKLLK